MNAGRGAWYPCAMNALTLRGVGVSLLTACCVVGAGCSDDESSNENAVEAPPSVPPPASSCERPDEPQPSGETVVVGSGAAESCDEAALRAALERGGHVVFDCGEQDVTIPVSEEIVIAEDTFIDGGGVITLDGGGTSRILSTQARVALTVKDTSFVRGKAQATGDTLASGGAIRVGWLGTLSVFGCVFADNQAASDGIEGGGAIYQSNGGALVVVDSTFSGNQAVSGGAIDNLLSDLTVVGSTFEHNESFKGGGAIYVDGASADIEDSEGGTVHLCGCRFRENESVGQGGAVYLWAYEPDRFIINQCSFTDNVLVRPSDGSALGGALRTGNAPLQLANSLFARNHADVHGGAYWTDGAYPVEITNSTFVGNDAGVPGQEGGYGGAISGFNITLTNVTMLDNHAEFSGGALYNQEGFTLRNSILANNTASNEWGIGQACVSAMAGGNNLQWPAPTGEKDPGCTEGIIVAEPGLGELSDNGGATETIPLLDGSPAIDEGEGCSETDQRGEPRVGPCDLGSFERQ